MEFLEWKEGKKKEMGRRDDPGTLMGHFQKTLKGIGISI